MISVILLEKISKLGNIGQEVKVKDGFARNYLIPNKKALRASKENRNFFEQKKEELVSYSNKTNKEIAEYIGVKEVIYNSLNDVVNIVKKLNNNIQNMETSMFMD